MILKKDNGDNLENDGLLCEDVNNFKSDEEIENHGT